LLRCLHSIHNRTPPELLHEIILINDNSTNWDLFYPFESYVASNFGGKVKLFVNTERKGLILSRMEGAMRATGEVVVFLDSHMEVNVNWLVPLLEPIVLNPKTATVPVLDSFSPQTLEYERLGHGTRGGFDWNFVYKWFPMRDVDLETPESDAITSSNLVATTKD
jgi:polypeptide N-acetylgalactosaminyltransferase